MQAAFAAAGPMLGAVSGLGEASFPARIGRFTAGVVAAEMRRAILWFPVGMAAGIALYLGWETEPPVWTALLVLLPLLLSFSPLWRTMTGRLGCLALLAVLAGHGAAQFSAWRAAMPALPGPTMATVEGRVVMLDRSASGAPRVLLDHVALFGRAADATPSRVRLTLSAVDRAGAPRPGDWIQVYARLGPPGQPVEPGAFDFARRAYFERIGAIGYARTPPVRLPAVEVAGRAGRALAEGHGPARWWAGLATAVAAWRVATADAVRARLTGAEGAFAAAILVGDRSAIDERDAEALRVSTLAHLLAISGLHMGLLCGLVFVATRFTLTLAAPLLPWLPGKKAAAAAALAAAAGYLVASGATVATQRAFVMASVALIAVMVDRPALTLRAVALAAVLVLAWRPISLVDPGFQMSFAATVALIATFEALTERRRRRRAEAEDEEGATVDQASDGAVASVAAVNSRLSILAGVVRRLGARLARGAVTVSLTSLVAGLATAPVAAIHFHRMSPWGLVANLLAVPVMGAWIAPAGAAAALAAPFGQSGPLLDLMALGIGWVLRVAHEVAALPGADRAIPAMPISLLVVLALAGLWIALWRGPWRFAGVPVIATTLALAPAVAPQRPAILIAPGGGLVGVLHRGERRLDHPRAESYAARSWLESDGDRTAQIDAAARPGMEPPMAADATRRPARRSMMLDLALDPVVDPVVDSGFDPRNDREDDPRDDQAPVGRDGAWRIVILRGKAATAEAAAYCAGRTVVVAPAFADTTPEGCVFIGKPALASGQARAIVASADGLRLLPLAPRGGRPWHGAAYAAQVGRSQR